jgi:hypothetical protein
VNKRDGKTGDTYTKNLLSVLQGQGPGWYGISIKATAIAASGFADSDDTDDAASGVWQEVKKRDAVPYVWWDATDSTVAHWDMVNGAGNATDYTVNVYRGQTKVDATTGAGTYNDNQKAYVNLGPFMALYGPGSYTFGVVAKGNGYLVLDAGEKKLADDSAYKYDVKLAAPANLTWTGNTATWNAVANAVRYSVQLYKNGTLSGTAATATGTSYNDFDVNANGLYTFKVKAIGTGTAGTGAYLDSNEADSADTAGDAGKLIKGAAASINFIPANESGKLTATVAGPVSISKGGKGSLELTVAGDGFTGFTWVIDGVEAAATGNGLALSGDGKTLTINAADPAIKLGGHSATVRAKKGDVYWSLPEPVGFSVIK